MLQDSAPVWLSEIVFGSLVLVNASWRRLERWERADVAGDRATWLVFWSGSEYPSLYLREPSLQVWLGEDAPCTSGVAS